MPHTSATAGSLASFHPPVVCLLRGGTSPTLKDLPSGPEDDIGSRQVGTLAILSLASTPRLLAMHAVLVITFDRLNTAGHVGFGEPNREPTATDSKRRHAISDDRICS